MGVTEKENLVQKEINEEKERISTYVQETTTKCRSNNEDVLKKGESLRDLTEAHVEATKVRWVAYEEGSKERVANHSRLAKEKMEDFKKLAIDGEEKLEVSGGNLKKQVEEVKDSEEAAVRRLATEVEGVGEKCAATMDSLQSRLIMERETVLSFVSEVLREDQPTGLTP